jgi:prepilin-type N-terminal cleavage/methylation domain-containing protein
MTRLPRRRAFTFVELLVVIGIIAILISIFVPYLLSVREASSRANCLANLRMIASALTSYANDNHGVFPRVVYDEKNNPHGYAAFTGPDAPSPFTPGCAVAANDVSASLWLLVRGGYISPDSLGVFTCPSRSADRPEWLTDVAGHPVTPDQRSNFRSPSNLSYSYCSPFSNATGYGMTDHLPSGFVILADKNPGIGNGKDVTAPARDAGPFELAKANSMNHGGAGQACLFADMHADFVKTPYCGAEGDNIYTALDRSPIFTNEKPQMTSKGFCGPDIGPVWPTDSYLVPTEADRPQH